MKEVLQIEEPDESAPLTEDEKETFKTVIEAIAISLGVLEGPHDADIGIMRAYLDGRPVSVVTATEPKVLVEGRTMYPLAILTPLDEDILGRLRDDEGDLIVTMNKEG